MQRWCEKIEKKTRKPLRAGFVVLTPGPGNSERAVIFLPVEQDNSRKRNRRREGYSALGRGDAVGCGFVNIVHADCEYT